MFTAKLKTALILSALPLVAGGCGANGAEESVDDVEQAYHYYEGGYGSDIGAASYINRDTGMPTENSDVNFYSSCRSPDREDYQALSDKGTTNRNVHNDACLFYGRYSDGRPFDGPVSFDASGVGVISACPDPDGAGPKTAVLTDRNGDGRKDRCRQSGYQTKGTAGDLEYHVRLNNDSTPGDQYVTFCYDKNGNGCADESIKKTIVIHWGQTAPSGSWDGSYSR